MALCQLVGGQDEAYLQSLHATGINDQADGVSDVGVPEG